jgi:hypothetical protein
MSGEQQQQPAPVNPSQSKSRGEQLSQAEIVAMLQKTIQQLDGILNKLSRGEVEHLPSQAALDTLASSTEALATALEKEKKTETLPTSTPKQPQVTAKEEVAETPFLEEEVVEETLASEANWLDRLLPSFSSLQAWWDSVLSQVRALLPASLSEKLSDWMLTGILSSLIVAVLLTSVLLLPQPAPESAQTLDETTSPAPEAIEAPPQLTAPGRPEAIALSPPPGPALTPEQSLIAAIQEELASITSQYPEGLIASIEADFLRSRLIVTLGERWYQLNNARQDKLANAILARSQKLDFRKLELLDTEGTLVARSPVVGNKAIILQRQLNSEF